MGNHTIGHAFAACAVMANKRRREGETALDILDEAADATEVRGMDAEFDDATMFGEPFCDLIIEAFGDPAEFKASYDDDAESEAAYGRFYDGPYEAFRRRYQLC